MFLTQIVRWNFWKQETQGLKDKPKNLYILVVVVGGAAVAPVYWREISRLATEIIENKYSSETFIELKRKQFTGFFSHPPCTQLLWRPIHKNL